MKLILINEINVVLSGIKSKIAKRSLYFRVVYCLTQRAGSVSSTGFYSRG